MPLGRSGEIAFPARPSARRTARRACSMRKPMTSPAGSSKVIKIGYVSPQTGVFAPIAQAGPFILDQIPTTLAKGITNGGSARFIFRGHVALVGAARNCLGRNKNYVGRHKCGGIFFALSYSIC
jgi:hypothetical protein